MRCPICQGERWLAGSLFDASFVPEGMSSFRWNQWPITAQACKKCGYVWLSVDSKKLDETKK